MSYSNKKREENNENVPMVDKIGKTKNLRIVMTVQTNHDQLIHIYSDRSLRRFYSDSERKNQVDKIDLLKYISLFDRKERFHEYDHIVSQVVMTEMDHGRLNHVIQTSHQCTRNNVTYPNVTIYGYGDSFDQSYKAVIGIIQRMDLYILGRESEANPWKIC